MNARAMPYMEFPKMQKHAVVEFLNLVDFLFLCILPSFGSVLEAGFVSQVWKQEVNGIQEWRD